MTDTVHELADTIASAVRAQLDQRVDLSLDELVRREVRGSFPLAPDPERAALAAAVRARLGGMDRLDPWLTDPGVDEVLVGNGRIWVERSGEVEAVGSIDDATTRRVIERVIAPLGRRLDRTAPIVDARLADGSRVCAVIEPIAIDGPMLSIRRFADGVRPLDDFVENSSLRRQTAELCQRLVELRCNVVVSGATSSGKTSLLGALLTFAEPSDRIVLLEDTAELPCGAPHVMRLEARPPTIDGPPPISVEQLVRTALRLRPDRLVVGEVRGDEVLALVQAMNTGHDGSFSTCHANSAADAVLRLESLIVRAAPRWPLDAVRQTLARSVDVVVHVERRGGRRVVAEIVEIMPPSDGAHDAAPLRVRPVTEAGDLTRVRR